MPQSKVAVTLDSETLTRLDRLVSEKVFPNRSKAVQISIEEKIARLDKTRLARECAKLDPREGKRLAEEGLAADFKEWPEY
jgi:metal-responsive CopG/Arc/MetJ family transcriptional regulator